MSTSITIIREKTTENQAWKNLNGDIKIRRKILSSEFSFVLPFYESSSRALGVIHSYFLFALFLNTDRIFAAEDLHWLIGYLTCRIAVFFAGKKVARNFINGWDDSRIYQKYLVKDFDLWRLALSTTDNYKYTHKIFFPTIEHIDSQAFFIRMNITMIYCMVKVSESLVTQHLWSC